MTMNLTSANLRRALPRAPLAWFDALVSELPPAGFDTANEAASFIAQLAHESDEFTRLEENLNYSAERLMQVWPRRFTTAAMAQGYAHNPERLANFVYAGIIGNGDEASGDGWRFRGRGPIQLTGRRNYLACGTGIGEDLIHHPERLLIPAIGIKSAMWFWHAGGLDTFDDDNDVRAETRRINGGEIGLSHRQALFNKIVEAIA